MKYLLQPCSSLPSSQSALWSHLRTFSIHFWPLAHRNWSKRHFAPGHPSSSRPVLQSMYPLHFFSFGTHGSAAYPFLLDVEVGKPQWISSAWQFRYAENAQNMLNIFGCFLMICKIHMVWIQFNYVIRIFIRIFSVENVRNVKQSSWNEYKLCKYFLKTKFEFCFPVSIWILWFTCIQSIYLADFLSFFLQTCKSCVIRVPDEFRIDTNMCGSQ